MTFFLTRPPLPQAKLCNATKYSFSQEYDVTRFQGEGKRVLWTGSKKVTILLPITFLERMWSFHSLVLGLVLRTSHSEGLSESFSKNCSLQDAQWSTHRSTQRPLNPYSFHLHIASTMLTYFFLKILFSLTLF